MSKNSFETFESEWSYPMLSDEIVHAPQRVRFDANPEQCVSLARRLGVVAVRSACADLVVRRNPGNMVVYVKGEVKAELMQECVVTLEPIVSQVNETFEAWFADPDQAVSFAKARKQIMSQKMGEETPILSEEDDPEPIVDGMIDMGELASQYLVLGLDPYPHAQGVRYELGDDDLPDAVSDIRKNPFAKLKEWKDKV